MVSSGHLRSAQVQVQSREEGGREGEVWSISRGLIDAGTF
jgi:hypothetical protein